MKKETFEEAKMIGKKLDKVNEVINFVLDDDYEDKQFSFSLNIFGHPAHVSLPKDMTKDMLDVCYKYKEIYEKQLEEL